MIKIKSGPLCISIYLFIVNTPLWSRYNGSEWDNFELLGLNVNMIDLLVWMLT